MKLKSIITAVSSALALCASGVLVGFSLIELLVVVAIIGILAAIGTVGYNNYTTYTKNAVVLANANSIAEAMKVCDAAKNCQDSSASWLAGIIAQDSNMGNPITPNVIGHDMISCYGSCGYFDPQNPSPTGQIDVSIIPAPNNPSQYAVQILACDYNGYDPINYQADPKSPAPFLITSNLSQ